MGHGILIVVFLILCLIPLPSAFAAGDPNDAEGSKDPDLFSRMPGFYISNYEVYEFDRYEFQVSSDKTENVEGYTSFLVYQANDGITLPSGLQITRNYVDAVRGIGGEEVYGFEDGGSKFSTIRIIKDDKEVWVSVSGANKGMYTTWLKNSS